MYSHGDFYASYYDHGCSIIHEKDVIMLELKGNSWFMILKRWWYNIFLLSTSNRMCRIYYHSTHAMKVERARHFLHYRNVIHPLSMFRTFWDAFILYVYIGHKLIFHHTASLATAEIPLFFYFLAVVLEMFIIIDIYVNSKSGYVDRTTKKIVLDFQKAFERYCSRKLFLNVAAAIPLHALMFLRYGMNLGCLEVCKSNKFVSALVILNTFSTLRFFEVSAYWDRERKTYAWTCFFRFLRICIVALITTIQLIGLTDTFTLLSFMKNDYVETQSYYSLVVFVKYSLEKFQNADTNFKLFSYDCYRVLKSLLLFNFGFIIRPFTIDKSSSLVFYILTNVFYMWGLIEAFSCISRFKFPDDQIITNKAASIQLAKCRRLPDKICVKLNRYYDFNMSVPLMVEKRNGLYKSLPLILKKEILMHSYNRLIMKISYFTEWPSKIIEALVLMIKEEIFLTNDVVAESGVQGDGLFILEVGVMAVYSSENKEMGHLIDGDYFGELSLVTDKEIRTSFVVAVTTSKILILEKNAFRKFMRDYPSLFFDLKKKLQNKYSQVVARSTASSAMKMGPRLS